MLKRLRVHLLFCRSYILVPIIMGRLKLTPELAFTDEERHFLAAVIQVYPCIWNECDPNYRDYQARVQAWSVIIEQFAKTFGREVTQQQMHKQYKNLRDVYMKKNRELKALVNAGEDLNGCIASKIYSWPFYRELEYLSSSAGSSELSISTLMVEDEQLFDAESPRGQVDDKSQIEKVAEDNFIPSTPGSEVGTSAPSTRSRRMRKRRAAKECENSSSETELQVLEEVRNILKESAPQLKLEPEADPFAAIGSHLADRLRRLNSLDPLRCEEVRLKIDLLHVDISRAILEIQKKRPNLKE